MTSEDFKKAKDKIEQLKEKKAKAKGSMDNIEKSWLDEYNIHSVDEASARSDELQSEIDSGEEKLEKLMTNINDVVHFEEE